MLFFVDTAFVIENLTNLDVYAEEGDSVMLFATLMVWPEDVTVRCWTMDSENIDPSMIETAIIGEEQVGLSVVIAGVHHQRHGHITCQGNSSAGESSEFEFRIHKPGELCSTVRH